MTTAKTTYVLKPGDQFHVLNSVVIAYSDFHEASCRRGQTVTVTDAMLDQSKDRNGDSWLDLVDDEAAQIARYGHRLIARGPCPEDVLWWNGPNDTASPGLARELALEQARLISDPADRDAKIREVNATYGARQTSFSIGTTPKEWS